MKNLKQVQQEIIEEYNMIIDEHSKCRSRMHVHTRERRICKWHPKSSVLATFELLHEIGHCENNNSKMRRCEQEYYATQWALDKCKELGIDVSDKNVEDYQKYIYRELDRGLRRGGLGYPSREKMKLIK